MSEAEVLAELEGSLPPSEFRNFQSAVISGEHFDCMLRLTPIRLAILSKQIEALSGRKPPSLIKQKKDYVVSYWRLALARAAHRDLVQSPTPQTPLRRVDTNPANFGALEGTSGGGHGGGAPPLSPHHPLSASPGVGGVMRGASCGGGAGQMGTCSPAA